MFIKKFRFQNLQNEEHVAFNAYVQAYITETGATTLNVETQAAAHAQKFEAEKSVLNLVQKNTYTERLIAADEARDKPIRGFFKVVKGMLNHFNPNVEQAAYNINIINQSFAEITYLSNEKQTAAVDSFLAALRAKNADIETLGLKDWVTEIETTQNVFVTVVKSRNEEDDAKPMYNMKAARNETDVTYRALVDRINAFITIEGNAKYANFVTKLNGRIDQFERAMAQRSGRAKAETVVAK
jgi:hypothetical protein